jgi:hypothetical protein
VTVSPPPIVNDDAIAPSRIVLVVTLYVHPGREREFRQFETRAAGIMRRHGGAIERVIRPDAEPIREETAHEIHVVTFPNMEAFAAYRSDPDLAALAMLRDLAVARTELTIGREGEPYA